jgi:MFS family permease
MIGNKKNLAEAPADRQSAPDSSRRLRHTTVMLLTITAVAAVGDYVEGMILPAIPVIQRDFNTTPTLVSWITTILLVVGAASMPLFTKLGDTHGKKRMFLIALGIYTAGVGIAGFSPSIYILLFSRGLQATGLALGPLALAMATDIFPGKTSLCTRRHWRSDSDERVSWIRARLLSDSKPGVEMGILHCSYPEHIAIHSGSKVT